MQKMFLTTPIYYVNDIPHIGHAYNILAVDTLARYWRKKLGRENVLFLTGTDENSQKTVDAAAAKDQEIYEYLEDMATNWRSTWESIGIDFDDFIRTTEARHVTAVHKMFNTIHQKGDIYKGKYEGLYCTGCEAFKKETDLNEEGLCPDHNRAPEKLSEDNYFFRLSKYEKPLLELFEKNLLMPEKRRNEMVSFIKGGLEDISISRESAEFGIELPIDKAHKIYVWFDALINYYSAISQDGREDFWNYANHIIGKDISKFHTIIWPAMLIAAGINPPQGVFAHGFFTIDGTKMSKTLGNVISPLDLSDKFGNDALRVGLLSSFEFGNDGDFAVHNFEEFYRTKLAGGVGNLFNRVIVLMHKFMDGKREASMFVEKTENLKMFNDLLEQKKLKAAIDLFFETVGACNQRMNETEVWKMAKTDPAEAAKVFGELLGYLEVITEMAEILLPESHPKMKSMLGDAEKVGDAVILFERV